MPKNNGFRHQDYSVTPSNDQYDLLNATSTQTPEAARNFRNLMSMCGDQLRHHKVSRVVLVHGTFVGDDAFGAIEHIEGMLPEEGLLGRLRQKLYEAMPDFHAIRTLNKKLADSFNSNRGNYTDDYATLLQGSVLSPPHVERFFWSSSNHHLARAEAAIGLLNHLFNLPIHRSERVQLWGHSHAGNVFALISNLLANDRSSVDQFFEACAPHLSEDVAWAQVRNKLASMASPCPLGRQLDMATFGTPVRYGWDSNGYAKLLHFVNHRPISEAQPFEVTTAHQLSSLISAQQGDYVQVLGIAGSDLIPVVSTKNEADRLLGILLETGLKRKDQVGARWRKLYEGRPNGQRIFNTMAYMSRVKKPPRIHQDGHTLLVDYDGPASKLLGHDVYTQEKWMLFHMTEIARRFYT